MLQEFHRLGTIAAVADVLNYSRSAVSQQLALLEKEIGTPLLTKSGRKLHFTEQGLVLVEYAARVLSAADEAKSAVMASLSSVNGTLRVTSFQSVLFTIAPPAITRLYERYPDLKIEIVQHEVVRAMEELLARRVDLILGEDYPGQVPKVDPMVHREVLFEDPMLLITPLDGPWAVADLEDLADAPFAIDPQSLPTGIWAHSLCGRAGFEPRVAFETTDPLLQTHLVRSGHAVAFIPALLSSMLNGVKIIELPGQPTRTLFTAVRVGQQQHPAIRAFRSALAEVAKETYVGARLVE